MSDPAIPIVEVPAAGASNVNQLAPHVLRVSPFTGDATVGTWDTFSTGGALEDSGAGNGFADPAFLETNDGTQGEMASATAILQANTITFAGLDLDAVAGGSVQGRYLRTAKLFLYAHAAFVDYPGATFIRYAVALGGERVAFLDGVPAAYDGVSAQVKTSELDLTSLLEDAVRRPRPLMLVSQAQAVLQGLRVVVLPMANGQHSVTDWYCGRVELVVEIFDTGAVEHYRWAYAVQICTKDPDNDVTFVDPDDVEYDSSYTRGGNTAELIRTTDHHVLPYGALTVAPGGALDRWARWYHWDEDGNPGATPYARDDAWWSAANHFTLLPQIIAEWIAGRTEEAVILAEITSVLLLDIIVWELAPGETGVYRCAFDRSLFATAAFFVAGFERDGVDLGLVEVFVRDDIGAGSYFFDSGAVVGDAVDPDHPPGYLYVGLADGKHPGANRAMALGLRAVLPMTNAPGGVLAGIGNRIGYHGWIVGLPSLSSEIEDWERGSRFEPSGTMSLKNEAIGQDPEPVLYRVFGILSPRGVADRRFIVQNRRVVYRLFVPGSLYADSIELAHGIVRWPKGAALLSDGDSPLEVLGLESEGEEAKLGAEEVTEAAWPHRHPSATKIREVLGAGHQGVEATLVDVGLETDSRTAKAMPGSNVSAVTEVYLGGAISTLAWTFDPATHLITFTSFVQADLDTISAAVITWDGDGPELPDYSGTPDAELMAGAALSYLLTRLGKTPVASSFAALDDPASLYSEAYPVRAVFDQATPIREAVRVLEATRDVYVRTLADGRVDICRRNETGVDAHTLFLREGDVDGEVTFEVDESEVANAVTIEYQGYPLPGIALATLSSPDDIVIDRYGVKAPRTVQTYHATIEGARARLASQQRTEPYNVAKVRVKRQALVVPSGSTVVLRGFPRAPTRSGRTEWEVWQIRKNTPDLSTGIQALELRQTGVLSWRARPL